jgi:pimeloyl-ACP methyl ester carboxylesterase
MSAKMRRILVVIALAALFTTQFLLRRAHSPVRHASAAAQALQPDVLRVGGLTLTPCAIGKRVDDGLPTLSAYCADFSVPEDWSAPAGRRITLKVAILRSETDKPATDLVTFLDGGPGGAATEDYAAVAGGLEPLRGMHHVLLIDQRGTGGSHPLICKTPEAAGDAVDRLVSRADPAAQEAAVKACLAQLAQATAVQFYTTTDAIRDLEAVRLALGGPSLDIIGLSYGSRVAQQYAGHYPDAVRSIVLDGPVPNRLVLLSEHARNLENALKAQFAGCGRNPSCAKIYGDPYITLYKVRDGLRAHPQNVEVRDPVSFQPLHLTLTAADLAAIVRFYAYNPLTSALLPLMLQQAQQGNFAPLLGQKKWLADDLSEHLASGIGASIICAEDAELLLARPEDEATIMGNESIRQTRQLCRWWPHTTMPEQFHAPLVSPIPTLVLAGELDPVTPPAYGAEIIRTLSQSRSLTVPGQGPRGARGRLHAAAGPPLRRDLAAAGPGCPVPAATRCRSGLHRL